MPSCDTTTSKKLFLLGLDGGTFNVIDPLIKQGKLPNLAKVIKSGVRAYLDSTIPPLTPVAWPGMFTGKLSGKTGVFDFMIPTGRIDKKKSQPGRERVNSSFIKAKPIWELFSEADKKSIVLDVPLTYPPTKINGVMISRVMSTKPGRTVYPKGLFAVLKKRGLIFSKSGGEKREDVETAHQKHAEKQKHKKKLSPAEKKLLAKERFENMLQAIDEKVKLIEYLKDNFEWDFFMAVFMESDQAGHGFWKDQEKVKKIYMKLDEAIGKIFAALPEGTLKIIASDHGFQSVRGQYYLDEWLCRSGFAKKTFEPDERSWKLLRNMGRFKEDLHKKPGRFMDSFAYQPRIDHAKSRAYLWSGTSYGIRINLKGRDPGGLVKPADYLPLRDKIIAELKKIKEPGTGRKIFSQVLKREHVIGDVSQEDARASSDIYFLPSNMDYCINSFDKANSLFKRSEYGFHRKEGIFFAVGEEFRKGLDAGKLSILDITPNILHIMGLEIPNDIDGKIRKEIFSAGSESYNRTAIFGASSRKEIAGKRLSQREEETIQKRLEALGYIE